MTLARSLVAVAAALLLTACLPVTTKVPVGTTVGFKPDPTLLGVWRARDKDNDEVSYLHFLGKEDGSMTVLVVTPPHGTNLGEWFQYDLRVATLGGNHYINAQEVTVNGKVSADNPFAKQSIMLIYRVDRRGAIDLYTMDEKAAAAAIKAHEIAGDVDPGQDGDVHITAGEPALDQFMKSSRAAAMFTKPLITMTRVD